MKLSFSSIVSFFSISSALFVSGLLQKQTHLTTHQWTSISNLLSHPGLTHTMKTRVQCEIFYKYRGWAIHKAYQYKKHNYSLCKNIPLDSLSWYTTMGLYKAILRYNSTYPFHQHADNYISYYICIGLTELSSISNLPHRYRVSKSWREKNADLYRVLISPLLITREKDIQQQQQQKQDSRKYAGIAALPIWEIIHTLDATTNRLFHYKYDAYFKKIRTNKQVAELLSCSSETVRQKLKKARLYIQERNGQLS